MVGVAILSLVLLAIAGVMIDAQMRNYRKHAAAEGMNERNRNFFRRQHRRRMQANVMIGLVGVLVAVWPLIQQSGVWTKVLHLSALLVAVLWMVAMAMLDALAINRRYRRDRLDQIAEQARYAVEMQRKKLKDSKEVTAEEG